MKHYEILFKNNANAREAFHEINSSTIHFESINFIQKKSLSVYLNSYRKDYILRYLFRFLLAGGLIAGVIGFIIDLLFKMIFRNSTIYETVGFIFLPTGIIIGLVTSFLVYVIFNEGSFLASENNVKKNESILFLSFKNKFLEDLNIIINKFDGKIIREI